MLATVGSEEAMKKLLNGKGSGARTSRGSKDAKQKTKDYQEGWERIWKEKKGKPNSSEPSPKSY